MSAIILTLIVGALNVCLGYVVAVCLGYGPPSLLDTWEILVADRPGRLIARPRPQSAGLPANAPVPQAVSSPLEEMLDQPDSEQPEFYDEAYEESEDEYLAEQLDSDGLEIWDLEEKFIETSLLKLNIVMMKSGAKATQIDTRLRAARDRCDAETIRACLDELLEDCEMYLAEQREAARRFRDQVGEREELSALGDRIETANLEQMTQIEASMDKLQGLDAEPDPEAARARLLEEIGNLRVARHKLRDDQEQAFLAVTRSEDRMDQIERRSLIDPLTRLPNRIGLEATLWQWWQEGRHQTRRIFAALLDVDRFERVNQEHGPLLADRMLCQFARCIREALEQDDVVGRFAGQQFLVLILDTDPEEAIRRAEFVRQSIERITFLHGEEEVRLTAGSGLTDVTAEDTCDTLCERLRQALKLAKQAGANRCFFRDGEKAEPVESANLGAKYVEVSIE
jgi:diguanylate cyclase (GGDEF)-like protein